MHNDNQGLKEFSKTLSQRLECIGEKEFANELNDWDKQFFTTSSEFLGELKIILDKIRDLKTLDDFTKKEIRNCIAVINKAFGV